ncbi:unnamed protein product, partial [Urochloa humidicola]
RTLTPSASSPQPSPAGSLSLRRRRRRRPLCPCSPPPRLPSPSPSPPSSTTAPLRRRRHRPLLRRRPARSLSHGSTSWAARSGGDCAATLPPGDLAPSPRGAATTAPPYAARRRRPKPSPSRRAPSAGLALSSLPRRRARFSCGQIERTWPPALGPSSLLAPTLHKLNLSCDTLAGKIQPVWIPCAAAVSLCTGRRCDGEKQATGRWMERRRRAREDLSAIAIPRLSPLQHGRRRSSAPPSGLLSHQRATRGTDSPSSVACS